MTPTDIHDSEHATAKPTDEDFAEQANAVFLRIQQSFRRLIAAVPVPVNRAVHFQRFLEIDAPLAWRVFKAATTDDPLEVADYILTPGKVQKLITTAEEKGLPGPLIAAVGEAMEAYEVFLGEQEVNRETLRAMVASLRSENAFQIDEKCRRGAFQHNALIWGQKCDLQLGSCILQTGEHPDFWACAAISGCVGMQDIRPGRPHDFKIEAKFDDPESAKTAFANTKLLSEFCSPNLDVRVEHEGGCLWTDVRPPGVGRDAAIDYFQAVVTDTEVRKQEVNVRVWRPTAMLHMDLFVPAAGRSGACRTRVFGHPVDGFRADKKRSVDILPMAATANHLGTMVDPPPAAGVPRYAEMVRTLLDHRGWYGTKFDVYRCCIPYPVMHSLVHLEVAR